MKDDLGRLVAHAQGCGGHEGARSVGSARVGVRPAFKEGAQSFEFAALAKVDDQGLAEAMFGGAQLIGIGAARDQERTKRGLSKTGGQFDGGASRGHGGEDVDAKLGEYLEESEVA